MSEYKPRIGTYIFVFASLYALVVPAIYFTAVGYMWFLEHRLGLDLDARPEGVAANVLIFLTLIPMIPAMLTAILAAGIPWMFAMAHLLSWNDIEFFSNQKGSRVRWISNWLDRLWLRMIEPRRPKDPGGQIR